jgi:outer membrane usher protein FimD/PapC
VADFRIGQWVLYSQEGRVGIYVNDLKNGTGQVDLVNNKGETTISVIARHEELKPAGLNHIPKARLRTADKRVVESRYK